MLYRKNLLFLRDTNGCGWLQLTTSLIVLFYQSIRAMFKPRECWAALRKPSPLQQNSALVPVALASGRRSSTTKSPAATGEWRSSRCWMVLEAVVTNLHVGGLGHWSFSPTMRQYGNPATSQATEQPFLGMALLTQIWEGLRKGSLNKCLPHLTLSANRG